MTLNNLFNRTPFAKNLNKQCTWIYFMSFLLTGFSTTLPVLVKLSEKIRYNTTVDASTIITSNPFLGFVGVASALIIGQVMFRYLNNKAEVDMYHSIPVTKENLFLTRYLVGAQAYLTGLKINILLSVVIGLFTGLIASGDLVDIFIVLILQVATFCSVYAFAVLGTVVTGNTFLSLCTALGIMWAPVAYIYILEMLCQMQYKFYSAAESMTYVVGEYTNPIYNVSMTFYGGVQWSNIILLLVQWAVVTAIAFWAYKKRPSETSGTPVAVAIFRPIIKGLGVIGAGSIGGLIFIMIVDQSFISFLVGAFIVGASIHVVFEMLYAGDVRAGLQHKRHFAIHFAIIALLSAVVFMDISNYDGRMEPMENIESIDYAGANLKDSENIALVYEMMENAISNIDNHEAHMEKMATMEDTSKLISGYNTVVVHLKNGSSYARYYNFFEVPFEDIMAIETSNEYIMQKYNYQLSEDELNGAYNISISIHEGSVNLSKEELRSIYDEVAEKLDALTPEYIENNISVASVTFSFQGRYYILPIYELHTETINDYLYKYQPEIIGNMEVVTGYEEELEEFVDGNNIMQGAGLLVINNKELQKMLEKEMTIMYGYSYFTGLTSIYNRELVFIKSEYAEIGYISIERFREIALEYKK